jgi:hypothetical protein
MAIVVRVSEAFNTATVVAAAASMLVGLAVACTRQGHGPASTAPPTTAHENQQQPQDDASHPGPSHAQPRARKQNEPCLYPHNSRFIRCRTDITVEFKRQAALVRPLIDHGFYFVDRIQGVRRATSRFHLLFRLVRGDCLSESEHLVIGEAMQEPDGTPRWVLWAVTRDPRDKSGRRELWHAYPVTDGLLPFESFDHRLAPGDVADFAEARHIVPDDYAGSDAAFFEVCEYEWQAFASQEAKPLSTAIHPRM